MDEMKGTDLAEVLEQQREIGGELSGGVDFVANSVDPTGDYAIVEKFRGGSVFRYEKKRRLRRYQALSLASFAEIVKRFSVGPNDNRQSRASESGPAAIGTAADDSSDETARVQLAGSIATTTPITTPTRIFVFIGQDTVTALIDERDGHERITFPLRLSDGWMALKKLGEASEFSQKSAIDFLRRKVAGIYSPPDLIQQLRTVKFKRDEAGNSEVKNGRESLGRSVLAELTGTTDFPEEFTATVPFYENARNEDDSMIVAEVTLCLDIDLAKETFYIRPRAGEIAGAEERARDAIKVALDSMLGQHGDVSIFIGNPE